jgi:hypothetical protein
MRQARALASAQPLRALWEYSTDPAGTALTMEFIALASHRKTIRTEIAHYAERFRAAQIEALSSLTERYGLHPDVCPPAALTVLITSISRVIVMDSDAARRTHTATPTTHLHSARAGRAAPGIQTGKR